MIYTAIYSSALCSKVFIRYGFSSLAKIGNFRHIHHLQMLKMVVKLIFSTIFLCRSAFSPYLCQRLKDGGSPSRRAAVIARTSRSGFFYARKKARVTARKKDIGGCHSVRFDIALRVKSSSFNQRNRQPLFYSAKQGPAIRERLKDDALCSKQQSTSPRNRYGRV